MNTNSINDFLKENLSEKRRIHIEGVKKTAVDLAMVYGADQEKAQIAALFHDMYKGETEEGINDYINQLNLDKKYINNCNLAHGKIAAVIMNRDYGVDDEDIINAVSFHTTGRAGMSTLEKIIYLADAIEPSRKYPGVEELRSLAFKDLDSAVLASLERTIKYVEERGDYLDEDTLKARDYLKHKEKMNG